MALETDWTSPNFDSYVTLAESDTLVTKIGLVRDVSAYTALTDPDKETFLVEATKWIYQFTYKGTLVATADGLAVFPRTGLTDAQGKAVPDDDIPEDVDEAQVTRVLDSLADLANVQSMQPTTTSQYTRAQRISQALSRTFFRGVTGLAGRSVEYLTTQTPAFIILKPYMDEEFLQGYASATNKYLDRV